MRLGSLSDLLSLCQARRMPAAMLIGSLPAQGAGLAKRVTGATITLSFDACLLRAVCFTSRSQLAVMPVTRLHIRIQMSEFIRM